MAPYLSQNSVVEPYKSAAKDFLPKEKNMKKSVYFTLAALAIAMPSAHAQKPVAEGSLLEVKGETGRAVAAEVEIKATITAIDKEKRTVTVKLADGKTRTFPVSKEAR